MDNKLTDIIDAVICTHASWMTRLRQAVLDMHSGMDLERIRADDQCEFGKWLYGSNLPADQRLTDYYQDVIRLHAEFHRLAARVVELAMSGQIFAAYNLLYGEYVTMSGRLVIALRAWQDSLKKRS